MSDGTWRERGSDGRRRFSFLGILLWRRRGRNHHGRCRRERIEGVAPSLGEEVVGPSLRGVVAGVRVRQGL